MFHVSLVGRKALSVEIYRQMRDGVLTGRLRPGDRLSASRELARTLGVSRMTVTVAYERLLAEGFATSRVGDGTFVSRHASRPGRDAGRDAIESPLRPQCVWQSISLPTAFAQPAVFDFRTGIPDASLFPHTTWRRLVGRTLRAGALTAGYGDSAGRLDLRQAIAAHIGVSRGVVVSADDVTVTNGTQQALDILARVLLAAGDRVAVEDPGYAPPRRLFEALGARVVGVPVDHEGVIVKAIPRRVRLIYVTPSHQYPLGVSMTLLRRQALLAWADRHNAAIIEDDYDSEFRFGGRPLESLHTLDRSRRVLYVGSFSKTLSPSLRLGFIVVPRALRSAVHRAKFVADWYTSTLEQAALARFIEEGGFARHLRRLNALYRERHELVTTTVVRDFADWLELIPSATGLHVTALARRASVHGIAAIARRAAAAGVAFQMLSSFAVGPAAHAGIVLGYGAISPGQIREGLRRLRECFEGPSGPGVDVETRQEQFHFRARELRHTLGEHRPIERDDFPQRDHATARDRR